ncbi:hypothetical protein ES708_09355 [subsurface metagenome]
MNKPNMTYLKDEDFLHILVSGGKEAESIELSPNITSELNNNGELIGIEILESAQAKILNMKNT